MCIPFVTRSDGMRMLPVLVVAGRFERGCQRALSRAWSTPHRCRRVWRARIRPVRGTRSRDCSSVSVSSVQHSWPCAYGVTVRAAPQPCSQNSDCGAGLACVDLAHTVFGLASWLGTTTPQRDIFGIPLFGKANFDFNCSTLDTFERTLRRLLLRAGDAEPGECRCRSIVVDHAESYRGLVVQTLSRPCDSACSTRTSSSTA
jgi:hypothetical protein